MISPAPGTPAEPMAAKVAVNTIVNCWEIVRSIPKACAMKTAATAWYKLVPFMLMVAPSGSTKLLTCSETPISSSTNFIVTGKVAELEEVEKPSNIAGLNALIKSLNGIFVNDLRIKEYIPTMTRKSPPKTTKVYFNKASNSSTAESGFSPAISTIRDAISANTP